MSEEREGVYDSLDTTKKRIICECRAVGVIHDRIERLAIAEAAAGIVISHPTRSIAWGFLGGIFIEKSSLPLLLELLDELLNPTWPINDQELIREAGKDKIEIVTTVWHGDIVIVIQNHRLMKIDDFISRNCRLHLSIGTTQELFATLTAVAAKRFGVTAAYYNSRPIS